MVSHPVARVEPSPTARQSMEVFVRVRQPPAARSIDLVSNEVREQLAAQLSYFERLDAKSGVLLGFAGLFVALAPDLPGPWIAAARLAAVVSAVSSLMTFAPRGYPVVDLFSLRRDYLSAEPVFTRLRLLDTHMDMFERGRRLIDRKARRMTMSIVMLVVAIIFATAGILVGS